MDRFGARRILVAGLLLEAGAFALIGLIPAYGAFLALMAVAGLANSVYHPADYSLLNASVDPVRIASPPRCAARVKGRQSNRHVEERHDP